MFNISKLLCGMRLNLKFIVTKVIQGNCMTLLPAIGSQGWVKLEQTVMERTKYYKDYEGEYLET